MSVELSEDISQVTFLLGEAKKKFEEYIKDKSVPLEERWEFFCLAPGFLKERDGSIVNFKVLDDCNIEYFEGDMYYQKYEEIHTESLVERLEEELEELSERGLTREGIDEIKEEILSQNLGSFKLDW